MTGRYRRARLVHEGYQVRTLAGLWLDVDSVLHYVAPLRVTTLRFTDGTTSSHAADDQIFTRSPGEVRRAARVAASGAATP